MNTILSGSSEQLLDTKSSKAVYLERWNSTAEIASCDLRRFLDSHDLSYMINQ